MVKNAGMGSPDNRDVMKPEDLVAEEKVRRREFPVTAHRLFMAHAGVAPLPRVAVEAIREYTEEGSRDHQESGLLGRRVEEARAAAGRLLGCSPGEVALLGPTSLGLNLVANGLAWKQGEEVVYYHGDYPANVYPWSKLSDRGVRPVELKPERPGKITWDLVESALTGRTRLVALATCHFLSGYRIDVDTIGRNLAARGILFCLDGIQTLGAFPLSVKHVDFLSADSHKWMLGPLGAGIFYVKRSRFAELEPTLLGSWNVQSPDFVARREIAYYDGGRRYEPGALNVPGIVGMLASVELLLSVGVAAVGERILHLRRLILERARPLGYRLYTEDVDLDGKTSDRERSGIISLVRPGSDMKDIFTNLARQGISVSLRRSGDGAALLRFSPHFYNTEKEVRRLTSALAT
jgi:selenocysteine lyase/cysteine desulfurase